jgi:hypothetical protein
VAPGEFDCRDVEPIENWGMSVAALSFRIIRHCADGERGPVLVNEARRAEMRVRKIA